MTPSSELALPSRPARPWVRDFALVGAVTGFGAPFLVLWNPSFCAAAGLGGALAGAALGRLSAALLAGRARRWPKVAFLPLGLLVGALWGASSALAGELTIHSPWLLLLALGVGGIAGALQLGWFWLAYSYRRVNLRSTWPFVTLACLLGPTLGWAALLALDAALRARP